MPRHHGFLTLPLRYESPQTPIAEAGICGHQRHRGLQAHRYHPLRCISPSSPFLPPPRKHTLPASPLAAPSLASTRYRPHRPNTQDGQNLPLGKLAEIDCYLASHIWLESVHTPIAGEIPINKEDPWASTVERRPSSRAPALRRSRTAPPARSATASPRRSPRRARTLSSPAAMRRNSTPRRRSSRALTASKC